MRSIKVDGVSTSTIAGCILTKLGEDRASSPRFVEETVFGMNGTNRSIEAYNEYEREIGFHCDSFEAVQKVISFFKGSNRRLELWHIPKSYYLFDYKGGGWKMNTVFSWDVTVTLSIKPFRYLADVPDIVMQSNGAIDNIGDVFSEPRITIFGNGASTLTIGNQVMHLNLDAKAVIECQHGRQNIYDRYDAIKNSIRISGAFFEIPSGSSGVVLGPGITRVEIVPRWRCEV
ncbi:TPA: hypothetical protein U1B20_000512 [Streptococcus suis]|uniref:hypothetical protein n=1 Tax=Streptococcus suis TaxID=1307 RepID=UPI00209BD98D|nr:hypothetical protein [Streptococcus suis]MCO8202254.1 hypothetical protein [Streptococcus suis]HEM3502235.1 hypothetical protein [Streptococcus suis]